MWRKLAFLMRRRRAESELDDELRLHLQLRARQLRESGASEEESDVQAVRQFGNRTMIAEDVREAWGWAWLERLVRDLILAARVLRKHALFSSVAIVSLALALGATTAVFSFARAIVFKKLPAPGAERLVILRQHNEMFHMENCCFSYRVFREFRKHDLGFEDLFALNESDVEIADSERSWKATAELVSGNYFRMLGVHPLIGRLIDDADDASQEARVCVISYRLWQERFGGRPDAIGTRVNIDGKPFEIVGVTQPAFSGATLHETHDLELPSSAAKLAFGEDRDAMGWVQVIGRLRPGVTPDQATARLNGSGLQIERQAGLNMSPKDAFRLEDGSQGIDSKKERFGRPVLLLFALVGVTLIVACANLSALLLVRSVERTSEAGVRMALGGSRAALLRHFLAESVALATAGGIVGWGVSFALTRALLNILGPEGDGLVRYVKPDATIFAFSAAVAALAGIAFGLLPAWRAAQCDPLAAIRRTNAPRWRTATSRALLCGQIALSLTLLFGAGLFVRTLHNLRSIDLGFRPENVVLMSIDLSHTMRPGTTARPFFEDLLRRARELPETKGASLSTISVVSGAMASIILRIPGYIAPNHMMPTTYFNTVSSGYFRTLGIPLLAGRDFTADDRASGSAEGVAIVNERFASEFFRGDALGKTFAYASGRKVRVVGIAANAHFRWLRETPQPVMYLPVTQWFYPQSAYLQVRAVGSDHDMIGRLRALVHEIDPRAPIDRIETMEMQIDEALTQERLLAFLSTLMGAMAAALAMIGIYGVMSFSVARRTREIGIRMAVGARRAVILRQFLAEGAWTATVGIALGIPLAFGCGKLAGSLLYGLEPEDVSTAAIAAATLAAIALAAALLPAWRAARLNPTSALRWE